MSGGFTAAMVAFVNAALVIVVLMFFLAFTIATAQDRLLGAIRGQVSTVKRWSGWVLIAIGAWFIILAVFADFFASLFPV
jgi:hypothetical protein